MHRFPNTLFVAAAALSPIVMAYEDYTYVEGASCQALPGHQINFIQKLPFFTTGMQSIGGNFANVQPPISMLSNCTEDCFVVDESLALDDIMAFVMEPADPTSIQAVAQSFIVWVGIGLAFGVLSLLGSILTVLVSFCCRRRNRVAVMDYEGNKQFVVRQSSKGKALAALLLLFFIVFTVVLIMVADLTGNGGLTSAQLSVAQSAPEGFADVVKGLPTPVSSFFVSFVGSSLVNGIERLNGTFTELVDFQVVHSSFNCLAQVLEAASLDRISYFLTVLTSLKGSIDILPAGNATQVALSGLDNTMNTMLPSVDNVREILGNVSASIDNVDASGVEAALVQLNTTLVGSLEPAMASLNVSVSSMIDPGPPSAARVDQSISALQTFRDSPSTSTANSLVADLASFSALLSAMPDTEALADEIENMVTIFDSTGTVLSNLATVLQNTQDAMAAMPDTGAVNTTVNDIIAVIDGLDVSGVSNSLTTLDAFIETLPDTTLLAYNIMQLVNIKYQLPCVMNLGGLITDINDTLVALPSSLDSINGVFDHMNTTILQTLNELGGIGDFMGDLNETISNLPNVTVYNSEIAAAGTSMADSKTSLDSVKGEVASMGGEMSSANLVDIIDQVNNLATELSSSPVRLTNAQLTEIRDLNATRTSALTNVDNAITIVNAWETTYGGSGKAGVCPDASDCGPGVSATCSDAECSYSTVSGMMDTTVSSLSSLKSGVAAMPDFSNMASGLNSAISNVNTMPSLDTSAIKSLGTVLDDVGPKIAGYDADMVSLKGELEAMVSQMDVSSLISQWTTVQDILETLGGDIDGYVVSIQEMNNTLADNLGPDSIVSMGLEMEVKVYDLLHVHLAGMLNPIRETELRATVESDGLYAGIFRVAQVLDSILAQFDPTSTDMVQNMMQNSTSFTSVLKLMDTINQVAEDTDANVKVNEYEVPGETDTQYEGDVYFLAQVYAAFTETVAPVSQAELEIGYANKLTVTGEFANSQLYEYDNQELCLSDECIKNTITVVNEDAPFRAIPLSRETFMRLPFFVPMIAVLLGMVTICCPTAYKFLFCYTALVMPIAFIVFGAIMFPMSLAVGQVCGMAEPMVVNTAAQNEAALCGMIGATLSAEGHCVFDGAEAGIGDIELDINLPGVLGALLNRECNADGEEVDHIQKLFNALEAKSPDFVGSMMLDYTASFKLRSRLSSDMQALGRDVGTNIGTLFQDASGLIGCAGLNDIYAGTKDAVCCHVVGALYSWVSAWYLITFGLLFCACPGSRLAKRYLVKPHHSTSVVPK